MLTSHSCRPWRAAIGSCLLAVALVGCTDSGAAGGDGGGPGAAPGGAPGASGSGGSSNGAAGAIGAAGAVGAAGASSSAGVGGAADAAGAANAGGAPSAGGVANAAGASSSAGSGGSAGSAGSAGASGSAGAGGAASTCPVATPLKGGKQYCSNSKGNVSGGGYSYELWAEGNGSGCMTVYGADANFSATWTNVEDFLARIGLNFDQTKTPAQIGTISADFAETKTGNTGLVYVGIYGWTVNPLREYYILEDWGTTKPAGVASDGTPRDKMGTITVDGAVYDVWKKTRTNKPAITGDNKTFDQYFSIRQTARQCGHISISEHFSKWAGLGLQLGNLYETKILLESQDSTGTIDFTTATVVVK